MRALEWPREIVFYSEPSRGHRPYILLPFSSFVPYVRAYADELKTAKTNAVY